MAIIEGKRYKGIHFYKARGKKEYFAYDVNEQMIYGLCADIEEGENPMEAKFHYCSPIAQSVFIDGSFLRSWPDRDHYVDSSWKKMPQGWRDIFMRDLFSHYEN